MIISKIGLKIAQDNDGHYYLIELDQDSNFRKWIEASESGQFDKMTKFYSIFNKCRIDSPYHLTIYSYEERE